MKFMALRLARVVFLPQALRCPCLLPVRDNDSPTAPANRQSPNCTCITTDLPGADAARHHCRWQRTARYLRSYFVAIVCRVRAAAAAEGPRRPIAEEGGDVCLGGWMNGERKQRRGMGHGLMVAQGGGVVKECSVSVESLGVWARLALAARLSPRTPTRSPEPSLANWSSFIS